MVEVEVVHRSADREHPLAWSALVDGPELPESTPLNPHSHSTSLGSRRLGFLKLGPLFHLNKNASIHTVAPDHRKRKLF